MEGLIRILWEKCISLSQVVVQNCFLKHPALAFIESHCHCNINSKRKGFPCTTSCDRNERIF